MEKAELRIGNFICSELKTNYAVLGINDSDSGLQVKTENGNKFTYKATHASGIYITKAMLLSLGFKRTKPRSGISEAFVLLGIRIEISNSGNFYYKGTPIPYIHKLQNLFYAIRGFELNINFENLKQ